jgi:hypothetical protein
VAFHNAWVMVCQPLSLLELCREGTAMREFFRSQKRLFGAVFLLNALTLLLCWVWEEYQHGLSPEARNGLFSFAITPSTLISAFLLLSRPRSRNIVARSITSDDSARPSTPAHAHQDATRIREAHS